MPCADPPELTPVALLAHLDGDADPGVERHLDACGHCRERAGVLAATQRRLRARLYRSLCPSSERLTGFYDRALAPGDHAAVADHVAACPRCRDELGVLERFLRTSDPVLEPEPATAPSRLKAWVLDLVSGPGGAPRPAAAGAGIRGAGAGRRWVYHDAASDITLSIEAAPDADGVDVDTPGEDAKDFGAMDADGVAAARVAVSGRLVVPGRRNLGGLEAQLRRGDDTRARAPIAPDGRFAFHPVDAGAYDVVIVGPDGPIRTPEPLTV